MNGLWVGGASLFTKPAPIAFAEIDRVILDDFFPLLIASAFQIDALRGAGANAHITSDAFIYMKGKHAAEAIKRGGLLLGILNGYFRFKHVAKGDGHSLKKRG